MPEDLKSKLAATGIVVEDRAFDESESADAVIESFAKQYDLSQYEGTPDVFPLIVRSSTDSQLGSGTPVTAVHISKVPQDVSGPIRPDGTTPKPVIIEADMFAFFTTDGQLLQSTYIGPTPQ